METHQQNTIEASTNEASGLVDYREVAAILFGQAPINSNYFGLESIIWKVLINCDVTLGGDQSRTNDTEYKRPDAYLIHLDKNFIRLIINRNSKFEPSQIHPDVEEFYSQIPLSQITSGDRYESNVILYYSKKIAEEYNQSLSMFAMLIRKMITAYQKRKYEDLPVAAD